MNKISKTEIDGLLVIENFEASDNRGILLKDYSKKFLKENGIFFPLKEVFYTYSKKGTIRANHFQIIKPQQKIIRVVKGKIFDVVVDLRKKSPTYKKWISFVLSSNEPISLLVGKGLSHGYLVLEDSIVSYKCDEDFYQEYDTGFIWNDETIDINWPIDEIDEIILSEKDKSLKTFKEFEKGNFF